MSTVWFFVALLVVLVASELLKHRLERSRDRERQEAEDSADDRYLRKLDRILNRNPAFLTADQWDHVSNALTKRGAR